MFFEDRTAALSEMWRVLKPGGHLAVAVWAALEEVPGYAAMTDLIERLFGTEAGDALRAPYALGDKNALRGLFESAGVPNALIESQDGTATFASIADWVHTDVKGWTLSDMIDDAQYETLKREAESALKQFVEADGKVRFAHPAYVVRVQKP